MEKWFRDRQLHYSKDIEDHLIEEGVESLEEMKLFDDWPELLRNEESPDYYPNIKWRKFEISFANLKKDEFDELKSNSIPKIPFVLQLFWQHRRVSEGTEWFSWWRAKWERRLCRTS